MRCLAAIFAVSLLAHCKTPSKSKDKEEMDALNNPGIFQATKYPYETLKTPPFLSGSLKQQPWSDTYWPLYEAEMAHRWIDKSIRFDLDADDTDPNFRAKLDEKITVAMSNAQGYVGKKAEETALLSPAEKVDMALDRKELPFLRHQLTKFRDNSIRFKDVDWGWMGNCHGWAPAAFMEPTPKNGVLLKSSGGQEVFFSPGEIRAVLTKAAADYGYSGDDRFMGDRCNDPSEDIPRDKANRIIDASLGFYSSDSYMSNSVPVKIDLNGWGRFNQVNDSVSAVIGRFGPKYTGQPQVWISEDGVVDASKDVRRARVYSTKKGWFGRILRDQILVGRTADEVGVFVDSKGNPIMVGNKPKRDEAKAKALWQQMTADAPEPIKNTSGFGFAFKYWKGCRDTNAGAFHLVLASLLSKGSIGDKPAHGFVMDVTRDDQVWNHPIYNYKSVMGEPTKLKIDGAEDPFLEWRAKGTDSIVDVRTSIEYAVENGPKLTYAADDESTVTLNLRYTLELDQNGVVLGGEWHVGGQDNAKPKSGKDLLVDLAENSANYEPSSFRHPDFMWAPKASATLVGGHYIPAALIKRLKECSAMDAQAQTFKVKDDVIPAVKCDMR